MELTIAVLGGVGVLGFFWWLVQQLLTAARKEASLQTKFSLLQEENYRLKKEVTDLQTQNLEFQQKHSQDTHKKDLLSKYDFNNHHGIYYNKQNHQPYCPKCLDGLKENQLKIEYWGWVCVICGSDYHNPDYRPPNPVDENVSIY